MDQCHQTFSLAEGKVWEQDHPMGQILLNHIMSLHPIMSDHIKAMLVGSLWLSQSVQSVDKVNELHMLSSVAI